MSSYRCKKAHNSYSSVDTLMRHAWYIDSTYDCGKKYDSSRTSCMSGCYFIFSTDSNSVKHFETMRCWKDSLATIKYYIYGKTINITEFGSANHNVYYPYRIWTLTDSVFLIEGSGAGDCHFYKFISR